MYNSFKKHLNKELEEIRHNGLYKDERILVSPQSSHIAVRERKDVLNMCANNYLGLSSHPEVISAAESALEKWGYGLSSVRFICGTQTIHKDLEKAVSDFLGTEDTILYTSCYDANCGLFETLFTDEDAVITDELNHASIIDGIRLCKAMRFRFRHSHLEDLERCLKETQGARFRIIATDGVFSMDGDIAKLDIICDLAEKYGAMVMIDDSHAVGFLGPKGRGSHEYCGIMGRQDIITGTFGKALGGASGGYVSGRREIIELLRQRSRPYLFSNTLAPMIAAASLKAIELLGKSTELRDRLEKNTVYFRKVMSERGFEIKSGSHPIVPIMLWDAAIAQKMASLLLEKGVYVIGFFYPVVPMGQARIRVQLSALHTRKDLDFAVEQFCAVKKELEV
ncbi:MAG: glycine C-acetyltransferase [Deltaproteobacteria bacterium]|nr:glycine C-acetyltransferase [Deltaproteobacteria bacterium]